MSDAGVTEVQNRNPQDAWDDLTTSSSTALVDVRTRPEWSFVGVPDLSQTGRQTVLAEWRVFPDMGVNGSFADILMAEFGDAVPKRIYFICRSGARSMEAAQTMTAKLADAGHATTCINIAEGFEGDLDAERHRGAVNGWKARGLPWRQS